MKIIIKKYYDHYRFQLGTLGQKPIESLSKFSTEHECRKALKRTVEMIKADNTIDVFIDDGVADKMTKIDWEYV